ncbi:MAG: hypothetical protein ABI650_02400 [Dokdonella sp.]
MNHDEYEWQAQEIALDAERRQRDRAGDDPLVARYRLIAAALAQPPAQQLPADFAAQVTRAVCAPVEIDTRFEQRLQGILVATLAVGAAVVALIYGAEWLRLGSQLVAHGAGGSIHWLLAGAACLCFSWVFARGDHALEERRRRGGNPIARG